MKKLVSFVVFVLLLVTLISIEGVAADKKNQTTLSKTPKVEVYYFHYSHRCITCQAVETESQKAIAALYPNELKAGKIRFQAINLDDKGTEVLATKCKVEGQALLVMSGAKRVDLTEKGFMYARSKPESLKEELKKTIDQLLK